MKTLINWPHWPQYDEEHEDAVSRVIRSNQLFASGEVKNFEKNFSEYVDSEYAVGVGNATQGLHLALAAMGIGAGDEVIVTPYSWISSASCVLMQNAIPVFVDIDEETFGLSPRQVEESITPKTKAVILVHMFGLSSKVKEISEICRKHGIKLIEDTSHAHGAKFEKKSLGTFGDISVFSLHQRKAIPSGDGGIICTDNKIFYEKLWRLRSFGDKQLSYNYRMTEFAAIGSVCLKRLDNENTQRRKNHKVIKEKLNQRKLSVVEPIEGAEAVYYANLLIINLGYEKQESLVRAANQAGIPLKRTWQPLHKHPHFMRKNMVNNITPWDYENDNKYVEPAKIHLPNSEKYQEKLLFELDCHPLVSETMVSDACNIINGLISQ